MLRSFSAAVALAAVVLSASDLLEAQGRYRFDLDVPAARLSFWEIPDLPTAGRLEADLEIAEVRRHSQWLPMFSLALTDGDRGVKLRFVREAGADKITAKMIGSNGHQAVGEVTIEGWTPKKGERFQVTMDWSRGGTLGISSDGVSRIRVPLDFVPRSLHVAVSTGELIGHGLSVVSQ